MNSMLKLIRRSLLLLLISMFLLLIFNGVFFISVTASHNSGGSIWTAAEESAGHDFYFWIEKAKVEAFERDGEIKLKIFRHATAFKGAETIKMTFTLTGWEVDIADGDLAFTFDVKEIPETWIWAKCECPGYYK